MLQRNQHNRGFSLFELLIVVVIIGIIAAIAIPNLLAARRSANEGSAISSLRTLHGAQKTYASTYGHGDYAGGGGIVGTGALSELGATGLIDSKLATGTRNGYSFAGLRHLDVLPPGAQFMFSAIPVQASGVTQTGSRRFGIATDGVMKADTTVGQHFASFDAVAAAPPILQ